MSTHVPNLVYLQNLKVLHQFIHQKLEDKVKNKEIAILQYQTNLYLNCLWEQVVSEQDDHVSVSSVIGVMVDFKKSIESNQYDTFVTHDRVTSEILLQDF